MRWLPAAAGMAALLALAGCSTPPNSQPGSGDASPNVRLTIYWPQGSSTGQRAAARLIPASTETIEITVSGPGISPDITRTVTKAEVENEVATGALDSPPGTARQIAVAA